MSVPAGVVITQKLALRRALHPGAGPPRRARRPAETRAHLIAGMVELTRAQHISSLHINFAEMGDEEALEEAGFLKRMGQQFHWTNDGYTCFDDYLAALNSRKRKAVKKERREALASGLEIDVLTGDTLTPKAWDAFYRFYLATSDIGEARPISTANSSRSWASGWPTRSCS